MGKIYEITCYYCQKENNVKYKDIKRYLVVGHFFDFRSAIQAVFENWAFIYENNYYNAVSILEKDEGLCWQGGGKEWTFNVVFENDDFSHVTFNPNLFENIKNTVPKIQMEKHDLMKTMKEIKGIREAFALELSSDRNVNYLYEVIQLTEGEFMRNKRGSRVALKKVQDVLNKYDLTFTTDVKNRK